METTKNKLSPYESDFFNRLRIYLNLRKESSNNFWRLINLSNSTSNSIQNIISQYFSIKQNDS